MTNEIPARQIRAHYDDRTIRVYQAYNSAIADSALAAGRFVSPPFSMTRMTWIKPSFLWMMYRAGWGQKDDGQTRILAIDISHEGFAWALSNSCPSHPEPGMDRAQYEALKQRCPVRVQWDPERDLLHRPLPYRAIQIGLSGNAVEHYVRDWAEAITDVTPLAHQIHALVLEKNWPAADRLLPEERPYEPVDLRDT